MRRRVTTQLGALGGGHADPGKYDEHHMLSLARFYLKKGY
jgi:hypothetical protein